MNHPHPGFLANYNSLTDKHLAGYFSNTRIRRHLQRSGLISRSGRIISEKEYRLNTMKKDHQKYIRECLAQAIFHKVLDMERHHQVEIKRKIENSMKKERVQRIKVERSRRSAEDTHFLLSPHPPTAPKKHFGCRKLRDQRQSGHLATYPRPSTAPGNIQHPVRLQPLYSNAMTEPILKTASSSRPKFSICEKVHHFASGGEKGLLRPTYSSGISPYQLPIINNYVIPVPPPPPKNEKNISVMKFGTSRGRRYRPTTAPNGFEQSLMKDTGKFWKPQVHTNANITMIYLGKNVHLCHDLFDCRDEIKIYQQHCGGENVCVYRGKVLEGDTFHFTSKRHHGFPFSLTFYLNGMQVGRLSSCCEYKHRKGTRLGGKHGHFGFVNVERSSPCYKCIIAMGLDKKPFPPKKKLIDKDEENKEDFRWKKVNDKLTNNSVSAEENKDSVSLTSSPPEEEREFAGDSMEMEAQRLKGAGITWERNLRSIPDYAYDEDFEADEEKSDEKVNEEGQADDQMNGTSKSPSDDEKDNLDHEKESKNSSQKALQASDSERDESDGYSESHSEEDKQGKATDMEMTAAARKIQSFYRKHKGLQQTQRIQPGRKCVPSFSSSSLVYSSENDSDHETRKQDDDKDNSDIHSEYEKEIQRNEGQEASLEEEEDISEAENATDKNGSSTPHENMVETNLQDINLVRKTPEHTGSVDKNRREDGEDDLLVHLEVNISEEEHRSKELSDTEDRGDCKSVKEKIAEAIEKDHFLSSEPEGSDSSTEEEEENTVSTGDKNEVPDGASLAEELKMLESQKATVQMEQDKQMVGKERTLEEEELLSEESLKEAALEEELSAKNVAALPVKQAVNSELLIEEIELKKAAIIESDLEKDNAGKDIIYEGKSYEGKVQKEELKKTGDRAQGYQLEREAVEGQKFIGGLSAEEESGGEEVAEEIGKTVAVLESIKTMTLVGRKALEMEIHAVKEVVEETTEADVIMGTAFVARDSVGVAQKPKEKLESEGYETLEKSEHEGEPGEEAKVIENDITEGKFLEGIEYVKLKSDSIMEAQPLALEPREVDIITVYQKEDVSEKSAADEHDLGGEISSDQEESCLMEELEETSQGVSKMKNLYISEDIALEKLETWMEEPILDWRTERDISLTEEKNKKHYGAIVTTEREVKVDKSNTVGDAEKEATVKGSLLIKEPTQEEDNLMQAVDEETEEESVEWGPKYEVAGSERKIVTKKEELFTEDAVEPEAVAIVAEEIIMTTQPEGEVDTKEAEKEGEIVFKGKMEAGEAKEGRKGVLKGQEEAEAETEREVGSKEKAEVEEAVVEREVLAKWMVEAEEAGRKVVLKGKVGAEEPDMEREVSVKGKVDAEEAGEKIVFKGKVQAEEPEVGKEVVIKGKVDAEETRAGEKVVLKGNMETEETEVERDVVVDGKVDSEEAEEKVVIKGKVEAEHPETKGEVVSVDARPKGEIVGGQNIETVTAEMVTETKQVSESSARVVLGIRGENQENRKDIEARIQDEVETNEDTLRAEAAVDALLQKEMVPVEDKEEVEEAGTEEDKIREEIIPVKYVEEALLFGIQKLITEVSHINVEAMKDGFEDLVEQMSSHEDTTREDIFVAVVEEKKISKSDSSEERETKELGEVIHLEEKDKSGTSQIKKEESQIENPSATESIPMNIEHCESEQQQHITAQMIYLEACVSSDLEDRN